ncbi:MAG: hypothetical protein E7426_00320 [Ruminococcaceae bacterium]|nr:hypothetical protein [Oscillospiraceae bacterium]
MTKSLVRVALCQRCSSGSFEHNLSASAAMVRQAAQMYEGLDVIILPEANSFFPHSPEESRACAQEIPGPYTDVFSALARELDVNIIPGSIIEKTVHNKVKNSVCFINRQGNIVAKYEKVHLMDALGARESDNVDAGDTICVFDTDFGRVGIQVCYDCRFPELARSMVLAGAEILFVPACFPCGNLLPPRTDHWDLLVDAMALQNLTWVVACNQYGDLETEHPFGRSRVVSPWGTPVSVAREGDCILYAAMDMEYQSSVRAKVGGLSNRRPDVYRL